MRESFVGYYPPTSEEYERLWKEALIVLDTNVLLNLYRLPTSARDEFFSVLDLLKDRLWIPHQVALEFQRRRLSVIATERKATESALGSAQDLVSELRKKVDSLQIEKRDLGLDTKPILDDLEKANEKLVKCIESAHHSQFEIASTDPVREKLDILLALKVGVGPSTEQELGELTKNGEERFLERIPPGFADAEKDKNPNEATFVHDHLKYQRKFGDLILWRQLINYVNKSSIKSVLLITSDRKEDWWWREQGKTIGAHPELVSEIRRETEIELFWMYSAVQFIEHANKYTAAKVSKQAVQELQQVIVSPSTVRISSEFNQYLGSSFESLRPEVTKGRRGLRQVTRYTEEKVAKWLSGSYGTLIFNYQGFPDIVASSEEGKHGYEVKTVRDISKILTSSVSAGVRQGYIEIEEGRLTTFTMIIVIDEVEFFHFKGDEGLRHLESILELLLPRHPSVSIIAGTILGDSFEVITMQHGWGSSRFDESDDEL